MFRLVKIAFMVLVGVAWLTSVQAQIGSMGEAIDKAGSQRMLTQRIVKDYCLIVLGVKEDNYSRSLSEAVNRFESQLSELMVYAPAESVQQAFAQVDRLWGSFKVLATSPPQRDSVVQLRNEAEDLLRASHQAVLALETVSGSPAGRIVNISGRQRMLSQRMANLYMISALGLESSQYGSDLRLAEKEFKDALKELLAADINSDEVDSYLKRVRTQFSLFEFSLKKRDNNHFPFVIADAAEKILNTMNKVTGMYAGLLN